MRITDLTGAIKAHGNILIFPGYDYIKIEHCQIKVLTQSDQEFIDSLIYKETVRKYGNPIFIKTKDVYDYDGYLNHLE